MKASLYDTYIGQYVHTDNPLHKRYIVHLRVAFPRIIVIFGGTFDLRLSTEAGVGHLRPSMIAPAVTNRQKTKNIVKVSSQLQLRQPTSINSKVPFKSSLDGSACAH